MPRVRLLSLTAVALSGVPAPALLSGVAVRPPGVPEKAVKYESAKFTQKLHNNDPYGRLTEPVPIKSLPDKDWHQSGGMRGVAGVVSEKYRLVTGGWHKRDWVTVGNQKELGITREYAAGTRFDDVLKYKGKVFEHRVREKTADGWESYVLSEDEAARPPGYTGLKVSCGSCHSKPGTGGYAEGLVPGGDTVFSDPLDWSVVPDSAVGLPFGDPLGRLKRR